MKKYSILLFVGLATLLTACQPAGTSQERQQELIQKNEIFLTAPAMAVTISRQDCTTLEVTSGTQVMWINADTVALAVTIEHLDESGAVTDTENYNLDPEAMLTKIFNEPATYHYTCSEDMDWYSTIRVKE
jgi:plastocyanin